MVGLVNRLLNSSCEHLTCMFSTNVSHSMLNAGFHCFSWCSLFFLLQLFSFIHSFMVKISISNNQKEFTFKEMLSGGCSEFLLLTIQSESCSKCSRVSALHTTTGSPGVSVHPAPAATTCKSSLTVSTLISLKKPGCLETDYILKASEFPFVCFGTCDRHFKVSSLTSSWRPVHPVTRVH